MPVIPYITLQDLDNLGYSASSNPNLFNALIDIAKSYINSFVQTDDLGLHEVIQEFDNCCDSCQTICNNTCNDNYIMVNHINPIKVIETGTPLLPYTGPQKFRGRKLYIDKSQIIGDPYFGTYEIKYTAGFNPIPNDIKSAMFMIISDIYNQLCRLCKDSIKDKTTGEQVCDYNLSIDLENIIDTPIVLASISYIYNGNSNIININQTFSDVGLFLTYLNSLNIGTFTYFQGVLKCIGNKYQLSNIITGNNNSNPLFTGFDFDITDVNNYGPGFDITNIWMTEAQLPTGQFRPSGLANDPSNLLLMTNQTAIQTFIDTYIIPEHNNSYNQGLVVGDILYKVNPNNTATLRVKPLTDLSRNFVFTDDINSFGNRKFNAVIPTTNILPSITTIPFIQSNCILGCSDNSGCVSGPVGAIKAISQGDLKVDYRDIDTSMLQYLPSIRQKSSSDIQNILGPILDKYKKLNIYGSC